MAESRAERRARRALVEAAEGSKEEKSSTKSKSSKAAKSKSAKGKRPGSRRSEDKASQTRTKRPHKDPVSSARKAVDPKSPCSIMKSCGGCTALNRPYKKQLAAKQAAMGELFASLCEREGIAIYAGWGPKEVQTENGKAANIAFVKCLSVKDESGRFAPVYDENTVQMAPCGTVLYCIGQKAEWKTLLAGTQVEFNPNGTAKADPVTYQTAEPDIFVGGDAYTGQKFAIDAIAAGKQGAISLHRYVQPGQSLTLARNPRDFYELDKDNVVIDINCFDAPVRQEVKHDPRKAKTMKNDRVTFTEEQVKAEASRCLGCGVSVVDQNKCIGCGLCTTRCEFDAIHLHRDHPEASKMVTTDDKIPPLAAYAAKRAVKIKIKDLKEKLAK